MRDAQLNHGPRRDDSKLGISSVLINRADYLSKVEWAPPSKAVGSQAIGLIAETLELRRGSARFSPFLFIQV